VRLNLFAASSSFPTPWAKTHLALEALEGFIGSPRGEYPARDHGRRPEHPVHPKDALARYTADPKHGLTCVGRAAYVDCFSSE